MTIKTIHIEEGQTSVLDYLQKGLEACGQKYIFSSGFSTEAGMLQHIEKSKPDVIFIHCEDDNHSIRLGNFVEKNHPGITIYMVKNIESQESENEEEFSLNGIADPDSILMEPITGGNIPAFPFVEPEESTAVETGMTLLDYFASKAMAQIVAQLNNFDEQKLTDVSYGYGYALEMIVARKAYEYAAAMMRIRQAFTPL